MIPIPDWAVQGGAVSLLGFVVLMVLFGMLVPRPFYRQVVKERDMWQKTALTAMGQSEALLPAAQIATQVTKALGEATVVDTVEGVA